MSVVSISQTFLWEEKQYWISKFFFFFFKFISEWKRVSAGKRQHRIINLSRISLANRVYSWETYPEVKCLSSSFHKKKKNPKKHIYPFFPVWWKQKYKNKKTLPIFSLITEIRGLLSYIYFNSNMPKALGTSPWRALCTLEPKARHFL